jgi:nitrogen regulatory protein PII 2
MKEIYAIIRINRVSDTKEALKTIGFPAMTVMPVMGRGKQKGLIEEITFQLSPETIEKAEKATGMMYVPKRMLFIVVDDSAVTKVVETIIKVNQTGKIGDGRIFVCPSEGAIRIRTGEEGKQALV